MTLLARRRTATATALLVTVVGAGCGAGANGAGAGGEMLVVVAAPVSTAGWVAQFEQRGAQLAAAKLNAAGGVRYGGRAHRVVIRVRDDAGSPQQAAAIARAAVADHAAMIISDGVGAAAVAGVTDPASLPVFDVFDGGASIVDPTRRPTIFRMAPADVDLTTRLADYLAGRHPRIAVVADDSGYGTDGRTSLASAFRRDRIPVVGATTVPAGSSDVSTAVAAARRAGATTLVVWAAAPVVAATVRATRAAGWRVPIWTGPTGEDPLVRQRLADHPQWLTGVGFASFRITAEVGPAPFAAYRAAYEQRFGVDRVGVAQDGKPVHQPPDWSMFGYDSVRLVAAALEKAGGTGPPLLHTLAGGVVITGANGDERGYSPTTREGVSPDDMYFAVFHGFVFAPVTDDLLSQNLPAVPQT